MATSRGVVSGSEQGPGKEHPTISDLFKILDASASPCYRVFREVGRHVESQDSRSDDQRRARRDYPLMLESISESRAVSGERRTCPGKDELMVPIGSNGG